MYNQIAEATRYIAEQAQETPHAGIVLGTGLGSLADQIVDPVAIPYRNIPGFPHSTVEGHRGMMILGRLGGKPVVAMQGRFHYYEGYGMQEVTFGIRVMKLLGIKCLVLSNAAGGINPLFNVGDLMVIRDHINFFPENPLRGANLDEFGPRFPDMSEPYDRKMIAKGHQIASELGFNLHEGVYIGNPGPSFETPAEYTHYRIIGGDAIGMSTIPEVIVARHMGVPVFAVSVITNKAVPGEFGVNSHLDVQQAAMQATDRLSRLISGMLSQGEDPE